MTALSEALRNLSTEDPVAQMYLARATAEIEALERARDERQRKVAEWCAAAFGVDQASSLRHRALRLLEEALEAYQATGADPAMAHNLVDFVFSRPAGDLAQEIGGVGTTLLALASTAGLSADAAEAAELERVLAKPLAYFAARDKAKNDAGFSPVDDVR